MIKFRGRFKGGGFLSDFKKIQGLDKEAIEVGWFDDRHPTAEMSFAELAHYHATGGKGKVFIRDVLNTVQSVYPFKQDGRATDALMKWLAGETGSKDLLDLIGQDYVDKIKSLFGSDYLLPTNLNPDPLIDTGELRKATRAKRKSE